MSTDSNGTNQVGVDLSLAGLSMQVILLFAFCVLFADYIIRYRWSTDRRPFSGKEKMFFGGLAAAIVLIEGRCCYRVHELSEGYDSDNFRNEGLFYGLEGV